MKKTLSQRLINNKSLSTVLLLLILFTLLFFRNIRSFVYPLPWAEDFFIFINQEYSIGFPATAFKLYAGYIHLLPRIITWFSMKFGLSNAMTVMNWTVLLIKIMTFYLIFASKEISSNLIKFSVIIYLVLLPFSVEVYNNVTNLQWWLIPLMVVVILRQETNNLVLAFDICLLLLTCLTGINCILLVIPCIYLLLRARIRPYFIKSLIVIFCACVQLYFLYTSGRSGTGKIMYIGGGIDVLNLFVNRVIYHTLFNYDGTSYINIVVFICYVLMIFLNLFYYKQNKIVHFVFWLSMAYLLTIFYNFLKSYSYIPNNLMLGFWSERYFVFLRLCSFVLLVSSLHILLTVFVNRKNYKRLISYSCFLLCLILLKNYPINVEFHYQNYNSKRFIINTSLHYQFYNDVERFQTARKGDNVRFHYDSSPFSGCDLPVTKSWHCYLQKK